MKNGTKYRSSEVKNIQMFKSARLTTRLREKQGLVSPCVFTEREDRNERMRSVWLSNELNADVDTYFLFISLLRAEYVRAKNRMRCATAIAPISNRCCRCTGGQLISVFLHSPFAVRHFQPQISNIRWHRLYHMLWASPYAEKGRWIMFIVHGSECDYSTRNEKRVSTHHIRISHAQTHCRTNI